MLMKCRHKDCKSHARVLTADELRNLSDFNLPRSYALKVFEKTVNGYCVFHAASTVKNESDVAFMNMSILDLHAMDQLKAFDPYSNTNFSDAGSYALCVDCGGFLASLRENVDVSNLRMTLSALGVASEMIEPLVWSATTCVSYGHGRCVPCLLSNKNLVSDNEGGQWERNELKTYGEIIEVSGDLRLKYGRYWQAYRD